MTPQQQKNVELIRGIRKELQNYLVGVRQIFKEMEGQAGQKEVGYVLTNLSAARANLLDALGEIGRKEYQREDEE